VTVGAKWMSGCLRLAAEYRVSQKSEKQFLVSGKYLKNCVKTKMIKIVKKLDFAAL